MPTIDHQRAVSRPATRRRGVYVDLSAAFVLALAVAGATWWVSGLPASYVILAVVLEALLSGLILRTLPAHVRGPGIGAANRVTLMRAALAIPVVALALMPTPLGPGTGWWIIGLSGLVLILDGVDGLVARSTRSETGFGARFDMELDAALILALSVLVWATGTVGPWILLIGLMRYFFVASGLIWPALGSELPPSLRRKVVCVVQGIVLLAALAPSVPRPWAVLLSGGGLTALSYSFAVDVRWALAHGPRR